VRWFSKYSVIVSTCVRVQIEASRGLAFGSVPASDRGKLGAQLFSFWLGRVSVPALGRGKGTLGRQKGHAGFDGFLDSGAGDIVSVDAIGTSAGFAVETRFHLFVTGLVGLERDAFIVVDVVLSAWHDDGGSNDAGVCVLRGVASCV